MDLENASSTHRNSPSYIDFIVIAVYFSFVLFVGLYSSCRSRRSSVTGYFLASRNMHWIPIGASLFASNIGSGHFIGLAGSGAASGIGIAAFELNAIFVLMILGWIFVPVYMAAGVYTMPEYLRLRFGGQRIRVYLAVLALILYVFTKISADLYAGALFIQLALGFSGDEGLYASIMILLAIAAIFTIAGGLTAVIWTDFVQTILMLVGAIILMFLSLDAVGGYNELIRRYMEADPSPNATRYDSNNKSCGAVPENALHLFRDMNSDLPWTGVIFGLTISSIWYWCSDQVIVQRVLASKNMTNAKGGCILAGYLKLLPMYLLVLPGMAARVLFTDRVACANPEVCYEVCGSHSGCTNIAYAELVIKLMPVGLSGLLLAVMMAALMSSLTSIFNSSSTIFTIDIWTRFRKNPTDTELLIVGRVSVIFVLIVSVLWVPVLSGLKASQLFVYIQQVSNFLSPPVAAVYILALFLPRTNEAIQSITSFLAPPICAVFFTAVFSTRTNEQGAFWGLMTGLVFGLFRFICEFSFTAPSCGNDEVDTRPVWIQIFLSDVHYLHYGIGLFILTLGVTISISYLTEPIDPEKLHRLTFWTRHSTSVRRPIDDDESHEIKIHSEEDISHSKSVDSKNENTWYRKIFSCICGIDSKSTTVESDGGEPHSLSPEEEAVAAAKFLEENKFWKRFASGNAILLMTVAVFIWAWYA